MCVNGGEPNKIEDVKGILSEVLALDGVAAGIAAAVAAVYFFFLKRNLIKSSHE